MQDADTEDSNGSAKAFSNRAIASPATADAVIPPAASTHWVLDVNFATTAVNLSNGPPTSAAPANSKLDYLHAQLPSIGTGVVVLHTARPQRPPPGWRAAPCLCILLRKYCAVLVSWWAAAALY